MFLNRVCGGGLWTEDLLTCPLLISSTSTIIKKKTSDPHLLLPILTPLVQKSKLSPPKPNPRRHNPGNATRTGSEHCPLRLCILPERPQRQFHLWPLSRRKARRETQRHLHACESVFEDFVRVSQDSRCCTDFRQYLRAESAVGGVS